MCKGTVMQRYEFKVVPAPRRGERARGVKTTEDRFALALTLLMNDLGAEGWDYVRADALPCDERAGFTGTKTTTHNMLVFRRPLPAEAEDVAMPAPPAPRIQPEPEGPATPRPLGPAAAPLPEATLMLGPARTAPGTE